MLSSALITSEAVSFQAKGIFLRMQKSTDYKGKQSKGVHGEVHEASVICD